ncbi:MAG: hypothetical protein Ct9H300mP16_01660 [Pseudomonadota bacterium]|nr:MAG: hypothetical protein Ct9H300mP16_01660 [Pseudomonadota bacterium]
MSWIFVGRTKDRHDCVTDVFIPHPPMCLDDPADSREELIERFEHNAGWLGFGQSGKPFDVTEKHRDRALLSSKLDVFGQQLGGNLG